jgi:aminobenzoyl-glutamate utilization protein B
MRPLLLLLLATTPLIAGDARAILQAMDTRAAHYGDVSRKIWEFAEVGFKENQSAALLQSELRAAGFSLVDNVAGMPTAFTATWARASP